MRHTRTTLATLIVLALSTQSASVARAQDQLVPAEDMILDVGALLQPRGVQFGPAINGIAHQSEATVTIGNYQYATWYHLGASNEDLYLGRRELGNTTWEVMDTGQNFERGDAPWWDNHNVTVLGVSGDGSIHLSFDHHNHPLQYMRTNPGAATGATWDSSLFLPVQSSLDGVSPAITPVTYPRFIENPTNGDSLMTYRTGKSGNGNLHIASYDTDTGQWNAPHEFINGQMGVYTDVLGSSNTRNAYLNGLNLDPSGRMHTTWTWREGAGGSNHDIAYAYSDDGGDTWKNNDGQIVGTPGSPIHLDSPGITVVPLNRTNSVMNQQTQIVDADGGVHALMWHASDANANAVLGYSPEKSSYFHYFRDPGTQVLADYFDGSGTALNGEVPDATLSGGAWETGSTFLDNGAAQTTVSASVSGQAAHLDFAPEAGRVYTAEATIVNNQSNWVGFGFMTADPASGDWTQTWDGVRHSNGRGYGWMLSRNKTDADQEAFLGSGANSKQSWSGDIVDPTQPVDMKVVLDTRGDNWTVEWYLNGESQGDPVAYSTPGNPGIGGIGFSHERSATSNSGAILSNFSLREGETVGQWLRNELPTERAVGSRPDVGVDADGNLYAVYVSPGASDGDGVIPIYTNGDVVIATASKATRWQDWEIVHIDGRDFVGEPRLDHARLRENGVVSIFVQENGDSVNGPAATPLHILEYNQLANKLAWHGGPSHVWDGASGVENWDRLGNNSSNTDFSNVAGERVDFDDDAATFDVHISGMVTPGSTTFRNATQNYTLTGGSIGGSGNLRVAGGGTVTLAGMANSYTGDTNVEAGTLALEGGATIAASANLRLSKQATLDVTGLTGGLILSQSQALHAADSSKVIGNVTAASGSSIVDATGTVEGQLTLAGGATLQIGGSKLRSSILMESDIIDDFSSNSLSQYTGTVILDSDTAGGPNTANWQISGGALSYQTTNYQSIEQSVLAREGTTLEVGEEIAIDADHNGGMRDIGLYVGGATPQVGVREDFISIYARENGEVLSRGFDGTTEYARAGGTVPEYDRLFIARTGENSYETGYYVGNDRNVIVTRSPTTANAGTVVGLYADVSGGGTLGFFDNLAKLNPVTVWHGEQFMVDGDLVLESGAIVQFDIATDGANDSLLVTGAMQAGGVLQVTLDSTLNALVDLTAGQSWDLFDFSTAIGSFDSLLLPTLAAGLHWDTSSLIVDGVLSITDVAGTILGDFNNDGLVNLADYTVWRDQLGGDESALPSGSTNDGLGIVDAGEYQLWRQHFGTSVSGLDVAASRVPEPSGAWLCALLSCLLLARRHFVSRLQPALVPARKIARTGATL